MVSDSTDAMLGGTRYHTQFSPLVLDQARTQRPSFTQKVSNIDSDEPNIVKGSMEILFSDPFAGGARLGALTHGAGSLHRAGCEYVRAGERQGPTFRITHAARQLAAEMWIRGASGGGRPRC